MRVVTAIKCFDVVGQFLRSLNMNNHVFPTGIDPENADSAVARNSAHSDRSVVASKDVFRDT
jgi:hypothetical protein